MLGLPYVVQDVPLADICEGPCTKASVREVLDSAHCGDPEAQGLIDIWVDVGMQRVLKRIMELLGESTNLTGGTMGAPNMMKDCVHDLADKMQDALVRGTTLYFVPPYSDEELMKRALTDYIYVTALDSDIVEHGSLHSTHNMLEHGFLHSMGPQFLQP